MDIHWPDSPPPNSEEKDYQEKLDKALEYLGDKYLLHPANHVKKKKSTSTKKGNRK